MQITAQLDDSDFMSIINAINDDIKLKNIDINQNELKVLRKDQNMALALQRLLNNTFKEGCKCGKGGHTPY